MITISNEYSKKTKATNFCNFSKFFFKIFYSVNFLTSCMEGGSCTALFLFEANNNADFPIHWRIQGGRQGRAPLPGGPNSFIFMQFSAKNWKIIALLGVGAPPWGKSWIRHCYQWHFCSLLPQTTFEAMLHLKQYSCLDENCATVIFLYSFVISLGDIGIFKFLGKSV